MPSIAMNYCNNMSLPAEGHISYLANLVTIAVGVAAFRSYVLLKKI